MEAALVMIFAVLTNGFVGLMNLMWSTATNFLFTDDSKV